nr:hypothetical protein [Pandoravirus massiliensis]
MAREKGAEGRGRQRSKKAPKTKDPTGQKRAQLRSFGVAKKGGCVMGKKRDDGKRSALCPLREKSSLCLSLFCLSFDERLFLASGALSFFLFFLFFFLFSFFCCARQRRRGLCWSIFFFASFVSFFFHRAAALPSAATASP